MNFKKKLFMMSLAASMIVPSNLALVANVATPVLAGDEENDFEVIKGLIEASNIPMDVLKFLKVKTEKKEDGSTIITDCGGIIGIINTNNIHIKNGEYTLTEDINLEDYSIVIGSGENVTINLDGNTITSKANDVFTVSGGGTLTLTGGGKVQCTTSTDNHAKVVWVNGIGVGEPAKLNVGEGVTLDATSGLGIYQLGNSETYLTNCTVEGKTGVDIQGGKLVVSGGKITGSTDALKVDNDENSDFWGRHFTYGAAIAMVPINSDYSSSIEVNINDLTLKDGTLKNSTLEGKAGLVLIDSKELDGSEFKGNVSLQVNKNTRFGSSNTYNIGYTEAMKNSVNEIDPNTPKFHRLKYDKTNNACPTLVEDITFISSSNVTLGSQSLPYTGQALTQEVTVKNGTTPLELNKDYIVEYANNTNVGTATVTVKGIREYTGEVTRTFEITPAPITENSISFKTPGPYSLVEGKCEPAIEVQVNGTPLVLGTDYTVEYSVASTQDSGTVTVTGKGNYTGTATNTFTLKTEPVTTPIDHCIIDREKYYYTYTGEEIKPSITVTLNGTALSEGTDYKVTYSNNIQVGIADIKIEGIGNYTDSVMFNFEIIEPAPEEPIVETIKDSNVTLASNSYTFTGQAFTPSVSVTVGTKTLTEGTDYTVTYSNNVNAGTGKVTVTGKGNYDGTVEKTFTITPTSIDGATVTVNPSAYSYTGAAIEPTVTVTLGDKTLTKGTDYTVSYGNNTAVGQAVVTVTGTGNYTGTATGDFTINEAPKSSLTGATVALESDSYTFTGEEIKPSVTVTLNGATVPSTDYEVTYTNNVQVGTATVTVTGTGINYIGTASTTFKIKEAPVSEDLTGGTITDNDVTLPAGPYVLDNRKCEPTVTVVVNGKTLVKDTDYNVVYMNSNKAGQAIVIVKGKDNYKGTVSKNYTIVGKTFASDDIELLEKGPYTILRENIKPEITVNNVSENNYDVTYSLPRDENGNVIAGEATVTVTGKGDYEGCKWSMTYLILDDTGETLDISFTVGDDDTDVRSKINLAISLGEDLTVDKITDEAISEALTKASQQATTRTTVDGVENIVAPNYEYDVNGVAAALHSLTPSSSVSFASTSVKLNIKEDSALVLAAAGSGLKGPDKPPIQLIPGVQPIIEFGVSNEDNVMSETFEVSLLSDELSSCETSEEVKVIGYEQLQNIDTNGNKVIEKEEMENYISKYPQYRDAYVPDDFKQDFSKPLQLGVDVYLDKDGFIEIEIPTTSTTDTKPSDSSSHKPTTPKPTPITPEEPMVPVVGNPTTMYRLYNRLTGEHLYTTDKAERDSLLISDTWKDEGQGWVAPEVSDYPVYRLLNPNTGDHHYTTDENEYTTLQTLGWVGEDIAFYSANKDDSENVILHRLYNPNAQETGMHHYTTDDNEKDTLVSQGWVYEGIAWAGLKSE